MNRQEELLLRSFQLDLHLRQHGFQECMHVTMLFGERSLFSTEAL